MMGLYPNAGQSYYLLHAPLIPEWTLQLANGKTLHGVVKGKGTHFEKVKLNGKVLEDAQRKSPKMRTQTFLRGKSWFPPRKVQVSSEQTVSRVHPSSLGRYVSRSISNIARGPSPIVGKATHSL